MTIRIDQIAATECVDGLAPPLSAFAARGRSASMGVSDVLCNATQLRAGTLWCQQDDCRLIASDRRGPTQVICRLRCLDEIAPDEPSAIAAQKVRPATEQGIRSTIEIKHRLPMRRSTHFSRHEGER
jgi:hypothetical protein